MWAEKIPDISDSMGTVTEWPKQSNMPKMDRNKAAELAWNAFNSKLPGSQISALDLSSGAKEYFANKWIEDTKTKKRIEQSPFGREMIKRHWQQDITLNN